MDKRDVIKYVAREWWEDNHTINPDDYELERYVERFINEFHLRHPGHNAVEDIAIVIHDEVINELKELQRQEREIEREQLMEAQLIYNRVKKDVERRARTHKDKVTRDKFRTKMMEGLSDDTIDELFDYYVSLWDELHGDMEPRPTVPRKKSFKELTTEYVITHPDELLTADEFASVSKNWNRTMTLADAYKYYQEKFFQLPGVTVKVDEPKDLRKLGFKNKSKYIFGTRDFEMNPKINNEIKNSFLLKENLKRFKLHKVAPRGTYIIDFMFSGKLVYLVAINVNTRYGMIELTNIANEEGERDENPETQSVVVLKKDSKSTISFLRTLEKLIREVSEVNPIKYLTGDGEGAFSSKLANEFYRQRGIEFHPVPRMKVGDKTQPLHSSLALIDRLIRTLRDMSFNARLPLTPFALKEMMRQYNNAPHSTLSKWIGFPVSPLMVQNDKNKEEYIVMKINKSNILTQLSRGFDIPIGAKVKVYNDKDLMGKRRLLYRIGTVVGKKAALYVVRTENGEELIPRFKLARVF